MTPVIAKVTTYDNIEEFALLGRLDHERSAYRHVPYCVGSVMEMLVRMVDQGMLFTAEDGGKCVGGIGGSIVECDFNRQYLVGSMRFWWVDTPYQKTRLAIRLLDTLEREAEHSGCAMFFLHSVDSERFGVLTRLFDRRGYALAERGYLKTFSRGSSHDNDTNGRTARI